MPLEGRARADRLTSLAVMAVGAAAGVGAWRMPRFQNLQEGFYATPGFVPLVVSAVLVLLGFLLLVRSLRVDGPAPGGSPDRRGDAPRRADAPAGSAGTLIDEPPAAGRRRLWIALALCLVYGAVLIGRAPFWLATAAFVSAFVFVFEWPPRTTAAARSRLVAIALIEGLVTAIAVTLVFERVFLVRLP
jgi:hypothetical protein